MPAFSLCFSRIGLTPHKHINIIYLFINHVKRIKHQQLLRRLTLFNLRIQISLKVLSALNVFLF